MRELAQKGIICYVQAKISKQTKAEQIISSKEQLHSTEIHLTPSNGHDK